jgi:D-alanine-D-alanine ligase
MTRKVAVLFGGPAPEHEVSIGSARAVLAQMNALEWDVLAVGVSKDGRWFVGPGALERVLALADPAKLPLGVVPTTGEVAPAQTFAGPPPPSVFAGYELVLPLCHGQWGEDGTLQGLLVTYGLKVIGSRVTASAVCFDKQLGKTVLRAAGIPVTPGTVVKRHFWLTDPDAVLQDVHAQIGAGPWFVKPNRSGSSIGVTAVKAPADLPAAIDEALRWDDTVLIEDFIPHRELLTGVVGSPGHLTVSSPLECIQSGDVLNYDEKYLGGRLRFEPPSGVEAQVVKEAQALAEAAFVAMGCEVFARVDLFLDTRDGSLLVNEVNTIPGMTAQSAFAQLMGTAGLPYPVLLEKLYQLTEEIG